MIYSLKGKLFRKNRQFVVIDVSGVGYKVFLGERTISRLPQIGEEITLFTFPSIKEDAWHLFGFLDEPSLRLFELLCGVNGVGPRSALAVLEVDSVERVTAAILEKRVDLMLRAPGIGKKTAERIILELQSKLELQESLHITGTMTTEVDVEEALVSLGYQRNESRRLAKEAGKEGGSFEDQLRRALRIFGSSNSQ